MKYQKTIISHPLLISTTSHVIGLNQGDTYFFGLRLWNGDGLKLPISTPLQPTPDPHTFYIESEFEGVLPTIKEGGVSTFIIKTKVPVLVDTTITWTVTHTSAATSNWFIDSNATVVVEIPNYKSMLVTPSTEVDFLTTTGTVTILTGDDNVLVEITTVDDLLLTGGLGTFREATVSLTSSDNALYGMQPDKGSMVLLLEDNTPMPVLGGSVTMGSRRHKLLNIEPMIDPSTGEIVTFELGYDGLLNIPDSFRTFIVDDTPIQEIVLFPQVITAVDGTDLTSVPIYIQAVIDSANRV